jgi:flagellar protein FliO/FliZ
MKCLPLFLSFALNNQGPSLPLSYQEPTPLSSTSFWGLAGKTIGSLFLVLGLILLLIFFLKKFHIRGPFVSNRSGLVKVISHQTLLPKRALYLVKVADRFLVLGVTSSEISFITELENGLDADFEPHNRPGGFSQQLEDFLSKFKRGVSQKRMISLQSEFQGNLRKIQERIGKLEKMVSSSLK